MSQRPVGRQLEVILAGHNGDLEVLRSGRGEFTPESLAAAYARISRSPEPVPELRRRAREEVETARRSNRTIVFGLGHHSVAEHAVLNFDILGCSRLAIEQLEWHRLASYTEKSQRYITLTGDHVIPVELEDDEARRLEALIKEQNRLYHRLLPLLLERQKRSHPELGERKADRTLLEGWAKEDARYVASLATAGQLGFTCNARTLELVVRRLRRSPLEEGRRLGELLFAEAKQVVPSLIVLADREGFEATYGGALRDEYFEHCAADLEAATAPVTMTSGGGAQRRGQVTLVDHSEDPDAAVVSALLFAGGRGPLAACRETARAMPAVERLRLVCRCLAHLSEHDAPPRAFEEAAFHFELVLDASAMAQLKRHRLATQLWGRYDPELGFTLPPAVEEVGEAAAFNTVVEHSTEEHEWLRLRLARRRASTAAADYALTNAHRRRLALTMSLREVYHFSRLREDAHAQWAIRAIASDLVALVREVAPAGAALLAGKDAYPGVYRAVMGRPPG